MMITDTIVSTLATWLLLSVFKALNDVSSTYVSDLLSSYESSSGSSLLIITTKGLNKNPKRGILLLGLGLTAFLKT